MKKSLLLLLLLFCLLTTACFSNNKKTDPVSPVQPVQETQEQPNEQLSVVPTVSVSAAQKMTKTPSVQSISTVSTSTEKSEQNSPVQTPVEPAKMLEETPQFKDEELISLEGRNLNPLLTAPVSQAEQTAPWKNEQLKYGVYYSFVKAGTAYIKNRGLVDIDGRPTYLIQTSAFSASVIDTVFKVRDINYSWIDATDFYSKGYSQSLREGNYKRDEWVIFDYTSNTYTGEVKKKEEPRKFTGSMTQRVLDILSALYYVRTHPLEPGQDILFDIINREEQYPLVVKVLGRETVKTSAGKFKCIVVEPQFRGEGIFVSKGKSLKVWLTDDKYKMPVKMKTEVFIGSVSAELLEYKRN